MATFDAEQIAASGPITLLSVNMTNVTKLTADNFLMWSRQVHALLDGYDLSGYLDESSTIPDATFTTNGAVTDNPAYKLWKRQDKLIYTALLGAISVSVQPLLSTTTTAAQIWSTLSSTYANPSRGHINQLRTQLKTWTKGTKSIDEYVQGFTTRFDKLALLGKGIEHEDQIEYILTGLPDDYKQLVSQIEGRDSSPSITEVHEKLINYELKLQSLAVAASSSLPITANAVNFNRNSGNNTNNSQNQNRFTPRGNQPWQRQQFTPKQDQRQGRGYQGRCQLCGVQGHSAKRCPQLHQSSVSYQPSPHTNNTPWQPRANLVVAPSYNAGNWNQQWQQHSPQPQFSQPWQQQEHGAPIQPTLQPTASSLHPPPRRSTRQPKPIQKLNLHTSTAVSPDYIPSSVTEALKIPHWRNAMSDEINSHIHNHTWDLVHSNNVSNVVGCRWVFTIKRRQDGSLE